MTKFNIGDRVKCLRPTDHKKEIVGKCGTVIDTRDIDTSNVVGVEFDEYVKGHECGIRGKDGYCWNCELDTLEKIVKETKLEDITLQKGDRVIFSDGEIYYEIKGNGYFAEKHKRVIRIERPTGYETIYGAPKDILDKEEKIYLSAVIKPFRNRVIYIKKAYLSDEGEEYISVRIVTGKNCDSIVFPNFKKGTKYKEMKPEKEYTLDELGL